MRTLAGQNTNALRSITGYNAGSPLRKMPAMTQGQAGSAAAGAAALGSDIGAIVSEDGIPAQSAKGEGGRILGETAKYAGMGMAFGPIGAGVGALVGLTVGLVKNKKAKEAHKEQMAANDKANKANAAQLALAANVNSQKAPATMKSPNEKSALNMAPLKKELSSIQRSSSYMRTPASDVKRQEIMRTVSGASSLQKAGKDEETGVFYEGPSASVTKKGTRTLKSETTGYTGYDDGSTKFDQAYKTAEQKKNKANEAAENKKAAAAAAAEKARIKKETEAANERASANAKSNTKT